MENERILSNAKFSAKRSVISGVIGIILVLGLCIGLNVKEMRKIHRERLDGAESLGDYFEDYKSSYGLFNNRWWTATNPNYYNKQTGLRSYGYNENEHKSTYLFGVEISNSFVASNKRGEETNRRTWEISKFKGALLWLALIVPLAFMLCFAVLPRIISKLCSLTLTDRQVYGQLKTLIGKKKMQIPIEHLDAVMTSRGIIDVLCGGEALIIQSNAGRIKFHYVQNADEFAAAAMKLISDVKKSAQAAAPAPVPVQSVTGSDAMEKINSLKQMLENGLITQEQFDQKREEILSKM